MTFKQMLMNESIEKLIENIASNKCGCPDEFGYEDNDGCPVIDGLTIHNFVQCWNREAPNQNNILISHTDKQCQ